MKDVCLFHHNQSSRSITNRINTIQKSKHILINACGLNPMMWLVFRQKETKLLGTC